MAVNLTTKYSPLVADRFKLQSITDAYAGKKYDFDGAQSIVIYTTDKATLNTYSRSADPAAGSRFGTIAELGDTKQTLTMTQDKAFTFSIDKGNASDQLNIKQCNEQLKSNWDEVCTPEIDTYRFGKWANGAGLGVMGTAPAVGTAPTLIATASAAMNNKRVPKKNRVLFISETTFISCKLATALISLDSTGKDALVNGSVGKLDGMHVVPVPDSYLPTGVNFIIKYKDSTVDPMKLKTMRVQKDPLGIDGDVGECRFYHDSFVVGAKSDGIYAYVATGNGLTLTLTNTSNTVVAASTGSTGIKYTIDGTDPKTSPTAVTVLAAAYTTSAPTLTAGQTMRAYAYAAGKVNSAVVESPYTA